MGVFDTFSPAQRALRDAAQEATSGGAERPFARPSLTMDIIRNIQAAERARNQTGRTRKSTFNTPGIQSMESLLKDY